VLHDALLARLAGKNQVKAGELLRFEEDRRNGRAYSDVEWTQSRIDRLEKHPFLTRWAELEYDARSAASLVRLHKQLRKQIGEETDRRAEESKATKSYGRSVESLFGDLTRNQLRMFSIADHRTGTMIHVNAIMISLLVALVLRNIDRHRDLLIPTLVLLCVNLTVVVLSIFSLRAGRKRQVRADTRVHGGNLLLATNEAGLTLPEYQEGMNQLLSDVPALQKAMVEYLHVTRGFLISRRRTLQLTYDIFICGLAIGLILFMIAIVRR
jgi:hypothetical protein